MGRSFLKGESPCKIGNCISKYWDSARPGLRATLNLMPRWFLFVTNWTEDSRGADELLAHYRKRGTFEVRLGEFNESIGVHLSAQGF
ncbi:hypothetical protein Pla52n_50940 [Stieleria varia]|uniref:Uncharacterized protein n=1 Tax=Stieleria varia TaxID=2528005 RepID=A0A5C6AH00_9BACT|nr:hypothetical protein Pla52n_50940 [Stieleria varia]